MTKMFKFLLLLFFFFSTANSLNSRENSPKSTVSTWSTGDSPKKILYFPNSECLLALTGATLTIWNSCDQGKSWEKADLPEKVVKAVIRHPWDDKIAFLLSESTKHYITMDRGKSWSTWETPHEVALDTMGGSLMNFHAGRSENLLIQLNVCEKSGFFFTKCHEETFYSTHTLPNPQFKSLLSNTLTCVWARSDAQFQNPPTDGVYCVEWPDKSGRINDLRLVYSDDFFSTKKKIDLLEPNGMVAKGGVVALGVTSRFLVVAMADGTASNLGTAASHLYVSTDGLQFTRATFPGLSSLAESSYTILSSAPHALFVDLSSNVKGDGGSHPSRTGTIYISDSTGTRFFPVLNHTNRDATTGSVDFERVDIGKGGGVWEGVVLANVVENWKQVESGTARWKDVVTMWSWDDGWTWTKLKPPKVDCDGKDVDGNLHLHSSIAGETTFGSPAPGVLLGTGNVGKKLSTMDQANTYLSVNGGADWTCVAKGEWEYVVGDQGALIVLANKLVKSGQKQVLYSVDFGKTWKEFEYELQGKPKVWRVERIGTLPDSSSTSVVLFAYHSKSSPDEDPEDEDDWVYSSVYVDVKAWDDTCREDDFEVWKPRDYVPGSDCILGKEVGWKRRKPDAKCVVNRLLKDVEVETKSCECTLQDYECDHGFDRIVKEDGFECTHSWERDPEQPDCKEGERYQGRSGYLKKPGDGCKGGKSLDDSVERTCMAKGDGEKDGDDKGGDKGGGDGNVIVPPPKGTKVTHTTTFFTDEALGPLTWFPHSSTVLAKTESGILWKSDDDGEKWSKTLEKVDLMGLHDSDFKRAYFFINNGDTMWTGDRLHDYKNSGSLKTLEVPRGILWNKLGAPVVDFHPDELEWLIWVGQKSCPGKDCHTQAFWTKNHGDSWSKPIDTWVRKCLWARDVNFTASALEKDAIYCSGWSVKDGSLGGQDSLELGLISTSENPVELVLYQNGKREKLFENVADWFVVSGFLVVAVDSGTSLKLFVSVNGKDFAETQFPPFLELSKSAFTLLESHTGSIFVDVASSSKRGMEQGSIFVSNSNGTFFTQSLKYSNRNAKGLVDYEKMQNFEGVIMANRVLNPTGDKKQIGTVISLDNGATWQGLQGCDGGKCTSLHIHSITDTTPQNTIGPLFSTSSAPGLLVGVGNLGERLQDYDQGDLYLSRDGGVKWQMVRRGAHQWEFGDRGGLIVAVDDEAPTDKIVYTLNYGLDWHEYKFDKMMRVKTITTEPKSTSLKIVLIGYTTGLTRENVVVALDFSQGFPKECNFDKDFEKWTATDGKGNSECLLGRKFVFWRRKPESLCSVGKLYDDPQMAQVSVCECTRQDFECDYNYWRDDDGKCVRFGKDPQEPKDCKPGEKYRATSGYRKISLSQCKGGVDLTGEVERVCGDDSGGPVTGGIVKTKTEFDADFVDWIYFEDSTNLILLDNSGKVWLSKNEGKDWLDVLKDKGEKDKRIMTGCMLNPHDKKAVFCYGTGYSAWYTQDRGETWMELVLPMSPNTFKLPVFKFHRDEPNWILFTGASTECNGNGDCHTQVFITKDLKMWKQVTSYVEQCNWARDAKFPESTSPKDLIFCSVWKEKKGIQRGSSDDRLQVLSSEDYFRSEKLIVDDIVGYALFENYMVIAQINQGKSLLDDDLLLWTSVNGKDFSVAVFPPKFKVSSHGYTVLESSTGRVFLDVYANAQRGSEWGSLVISNGNGSQYVSSLDHTNRNVDGFVDFEKMQGVEGVALVNQVVNYRELPGEVKKVKTLITFDDASTWQTLEAPTVDSRGEPLDCTGSCSLHLHGYTERSDPRAQFSQESVPGFMIGVGNVGQELDKYDKGNVYLTRDAGRTWKEVKKDAHLFEYGDHGGILLLVNDEEATETISYSLTMGDTWIDYKIAEKGEKFRVKNIVIEPDSTSQQFLLLGSSNGKPTTIHLNFQGLRGRKCKLEEDGEGDFELWELKPKSSQGHSVCLFGHEIKFWRRKPSADCFVGEKFLEKPKVVVKDCECTKGDYECDYGFVRDSSGSCVLMEGWIGDKPVGECHGGRAMVSTGYRKLSASTCKGGESLDIGTEYVSCSGGGGGFGRVFGYFVLFCVLFSLAIGLFVYWKRRGFDDRIMLPTDDEEIGFGGASRSGPRWLNNAGDLLGAIVGRGIEIGVTGVEFIVEKVRLGLDWIVGRTSGVRVGGARPFREGVDGGYSRLDAGSITDRLFDDDSY